MNHNRVRQLANQYLEYDMIQQHTELPPYPAHRVRLLLAFLRQDLRSGRRDELYTLVTSLVQMGLDTHDGVDTEAGGLTMRQMRSRQLKVLAGDYLSGIFYHLLANAGEIGAVRELSEAVCEVNLLKTNMYLRIQQRDFSGEQYIELLSAIKTRLFLAFEDDIDPAYQAVWRDLLIAYTRCEILVNEQKSLFTANEAVPHNSWAACQLLHTVSAEDYGEYVQCLKKAGNLKVWLNKYRIYEQLEDLQALATEQFSRLIRSLKADKPHSLFASLLESIRPVIAKQVT